MMPIEVGAGVTYSTTTTMNKHYWHQVILQSSVLPIWRSSSCDKKNHASFVNDLGSYYHGVSGGSFPLGGFLGALLASYLFLNDRGYLLYSLRSVAIIISAIYLIQTTYLSDAIIGKLLMGVGFGVADIAWILDMLDCPSFRPSEGVVGSHVMITLVLPMFLTDAYLQAEWHGLVSRSTFMICLVLVLHAHRKIGNSKRADDTEKGTPDEPESEQLVPQTTVKDFIICLYGSGFLPTLLSVAAHLLTTGGMAFITYNACIFDELLPTSSTETNKAFFQFLMNLTIPFIIASGLCLRYLRDTYFSSKLLVISASIFSCASSILVIFTSVNQSEIIMLTARCCAFLSYLTIPISFSDGIKSISREHILPACIVYILVSWLFIAIGSAVFSVLFTSLGSSAFICLGAGSLTIATLQAILM